MSDTTTEQAEPTWLRLTPSEKKEIEAIAKRDDRSLAYTLARVIRAWLEEQRANAERKAA